MGKIAKVSHFSTAKILLFFVLCKLFEKKMKIKCVFTAHLRKISGIFAKIRMFFEDLVMKRAACAALALVPEDVPIDLGIIATSRSGRTNVTEIGRP